MDNGIVLALCKEALVGIQGMEVRILVGMVVGIPVGMVEDMVAHMEECSRVVGKPERMLLAGMLVGSMVEVGKQGHMLAVGKQEHMVVGIQACMLEGIQARILEVADIQVCTQAGTQAARIQVDMADRSIQMSLSSGCCRSIPPIGARSCTT